MRVCAIIGSEPSPEADAEWLRTHGQQILELIRGFGFDAPTTLRRLLTVATGQPLSSPPKWCDTGCRRADGGGNCSIIHHAVTSANREQDRLFALVRRWMESHTWEFGQPVDGILFDCPCFSPKPDP